MNAEEKAKNDFMALSAVHALGVREAEAKAEEKKRAEKKRRQ